MTGGQYVDADVSFPEEEGNQPIVKTEEGTAGIDKAYSERSKNSKKALCSLMQC